MVDYSVVSRVVGWAGHLVVSKVDWTVRMMAFQKDYKKAVMKAAMRVLS